MDRWDNQGAWDTTESADNGSDTRAPQSVEVATATEPVSGAPTWRFLRGLLAGLLPLMLLAAIVALTLALALVVRLLTAPQGFLFERQVVIPVLGAGLLLGALIYALEVVLALRRVRLWREAGDTARVAGMLWSLGFGAVLVLLPLLLAALLPQHPAP
jgi:hypothetical protein